MDEMYWQRQRHMSHPSYLSDIICTGTRCQGRRVQLMVDTSAVDSKRQKRQGDAGT